ncbi:MAG: PspC domain-containing protein [Pseudomonadota bacterium]
MPDRHYHHHHHHWRDKSGYAHHAGDPGPGPNRHRLYKDKNHKMIFGVCSGIAAYYGWGAGSLQWFRLAWAFSVVFFGPLSVFAYFIAALLMKSGPSIPVYESREEEQFWRTFSTKPKATFSELKHRFRALDTRIADLETAVTSNEFGLRKAFRDLERGV